MGKKRHQALTNGGTASNRFHTGIQSSGKKLEFNPARLCPTALRSVWK